MPDEFNGIPLHPLVVHAVVVLVPLAGLLVLLSAVSGRFRRWSGLLTPVLATVALAAVPVATSTGESLEERVPETALMEEHAEIGEQLLPWAIGLAVAAWALWLLGRWSARSTTTESRWSGGILTAVVALVALAAVAGSAVQVYRIGHSGAEAVWSDTGNTPVEDGKGED